MAVESQTRFSIWSFQKTCTTQPIEQFQTSLCKYVHGLHFDGSRDLLLAGRRRAFTDGLADEKVAADENCSIQLGGETLYLSGVYIKSYFRRVPIKSHWFSDKLRKLLPYEYLLNLASTFVREAIWEDRNPISWLIIQSNWQRVIQKEELQWKLSGLSILLYLLLAEAYSLAFSGGGERPNVGRSFHCRFLNCSPTIAAPGLCAFNLSLWKGASK